MTKTKLLFLVLIPISLLVAGCCSRVDCAPCLPVGVNLIYTNATGLELPDEAHWQMEVREFNAGNDEEYTDNRAFEYATGLYDGFIIPPETDRYWTITSDSLGINDTLRIHSLETVRQRGCCSCGTVVESATVGINGQTFAGTEIRRAI